MRLDKRLLLAGMVVALLSLAVAASAFGAVWKDGATNVTSAIEIGFTGGEVFESSEGNGMSCEVLATLKTSGGSTGTISKWEVKNCSGAFGSFAGCQVSAIEAKSLPWTVDVNSTDLTITNMRIRRTFKNGCKTTELDKTVAAMAVTLNTPAAITMVEFNGVNGAYKSFGSLTVDSPNSGTYGIG